MINRKMLMVLVTTMAIATLIVSSFVPLSSAESEDNIKVRAFCLYQFEAELEYDPSDIINTNVDVSQYGGNALYLFESGSSKETQFVNYVDAGVGTLPSSDDRDNLGEGDIASCYVIVMSWSGGYPSETGYLNVLTSDSEYTYEMHIEYSNALLSYHVEDEKKLLITLDYDSSDYYVTLVKINDSNSTSNTGIYDNVTQLFVISPDKDYYILINPHNIDLDSMWTTVSYDVNISSSPEGSAGSGGSLVAAVFFVLAALFLVLIFKLYGGPKWSR
ncbi:MAG: hypothetical protein RBR05_00790 [Candidatus Methanomethylophilaceae archaeon]|nr:hypothetical protein [Candidatus Methanomethylophilaceae archaeon]